MARRGQFRSFLSHPFCSHTTVSLQEVRVCKLSSLDEEIEKQSLKKGAYRARKAGATALATFTIEPGQHSRGPHYFQNTQMTKI